MKGKKDTTKAATKTSDVGVIVSDGVGNYEKHPFFIKKAAAAKAFLLKIGLPKELTKKKHATS